MTILRSERIEKTITLSDGEYSVCAFFTDGQLTEFTWGQQGRQQSSHTPEFTKALAGLLRQLFNELGA